MFGQGFNYGFLGKPLCFTDTTDIFKDNSGVALYTLDYGASASDRGGKFGEAAKFNNTNSYVELPSTIDNPMRSGSAFTVSLWYKHAAQTNSYGGAIMKLLNDIYNLIDVETNGTIRARVLSSSSVTSEVTSSALTIGNWYHIVWTGNTASGVSLYINNSLIGNSAWDGTFYTYTNSNYKYNRLGYQNQSVASLVGEIDQVRFFNRLVTSAEVSTLYNESKETTNTLQILGDSSCYATYTLNNNVNDLSGNYNATSSNLVYTNINGTPSNVDFGVGGKSLYGARFNGSNSAIIVPNNILASNNHSISTWFYLNDTSGIQTLIEFDYGNRIIFRVASTDSNWAYIGSSGYFNHGISFSAGQWYHLAITFSAGNPFKIYVNGNLSYTGGNTNLYLRTVDNIIGAANSSGANGVDGTIDQVRLFNKTLSSAEVGKLYGNGAGEIACTYTSTTDNVAYPIANTAYYKLDNNSKDSARSTGKFNEGAIFNGSSSRIITGLDLTSFNSASLSVWIYWEGGDFKPIFGGNNTVGGTTTINRFATAIANSGGRLDYVSERGDFFRSSNMSLFNTNAWNHIVITDDFTSSSTASKVYVNGTQDANFARVATSYGGAANTNLYIGQGRTNNNGQAYLTGLIDQVRIYNTVLDSTDVSNLYAETVSDTSTLSFPSGKTAIATYQLDGNSTDLSGNYNGTDTDVKYAYDGTESNIEYRFGRFGQAAVFNGSNSYISADNPNSGGGARSFSAWIKTTSTSFQSIITNGGASHASGLNMFVYNNKLYSTSGKGNGENYGPSSSQSINTGNWVHCVLTMSGTAVGSTLKTYVNGILDGTHTTTILITDTYNAFRIGGRYVNGSNLAYFNGSIDQVRIFNSELTSSQVTQLYNEKPEVDTSNFKTVLYEGNGDTSNDTYISNVGVDLETSGGLVWAKARTNYNHLLMDSVRGTSSLTSNDTTTQRTNYDRFKSYEANGFMIRANNAADLYKINRTGNAYAAWVWKGGGLLNRSASFNGSNSKINFGNQTIFNSGDYSVSFWMNNKGNDSNAQIIFSQRTNSDSGSPIGIYFYGVSYGSYPGKLYFNVGGSYFTSDTTLLKNKWYHVVCTVVAGGAMKIYVNGVLDANSGTETTTRPTPTNQNFAIGSNGSNTDYAFNGNIDQVRIFNKAISSSEVTTLYNETASTINTLQVLGDTSCVAAYPLGVGAGDLSNTYSGTPSNVTFNNPGHLTRNNNGTIESTVSANTEAGFSIATYTGVGYPNASTDEVGHGLSQAPDIVFIKGTGGTGQSGGAGYWVMGTGVLASNNWAGSMYLNSNTAYYTAVNYFWNGAATNSVVKLKNDWFVNGNNNTYVMYSWHSVAGYSSIGTYTGNGSTTGTIVTLDFAPSFVMIKGTDQTSDWIMIDNKRDTTNPNSARIDANSPGAEYTGENIMDLNSNGFQLKTSSASKNGLNKVFIYMAFK